MEEFNNHLKELIEEYDDGEADAASQAPQSRHVRIENKNFFFSCKKNAQGRYITISEVKGNFRNSILSEYLPFSLKKFISYSKYITSYYYFIMNQNKSFQMNLDFWVLVVS